MLTYESCMHLLKIWAIKLIYLTEHRMALPQHGLNPSTPAGGGGVFVAAPPFRCSSVLSPPGPGQPAFCPSHSSLLVTNRAQVPRLLLCMPSFPFTITTPKSDRHLPVYFYREENGGIAGFCNWATVTRLAECSSLNLNP